ncbi:hypothetical protein V6N13_109846 [Hibiscus sabdariffa]|uniref:Uncharacterized protein n=1 Tax=Hibiscus sabdariffa TaxID=183260 RepID=A0ABR2FQW5_9ROSI
MPIGGFTMVDLRRQHGFQCASGNRYALPVYVVMTMNLIADLRLTILSLVSGYKGVVAKWSLSGVFCLQGPVSRFFRMVFPLGFLFVILVSINVVDKVEPLVLGSTIHPHVLE